ncbi:MAG: ArnT family glycosyltransferase [Anaerolineae bacterium]
MKSDLPTALILFLASLLPRVLDLNAFLTPDEFLWVNRSALFLGEFLKGDWAGTFIVGHPGLTTRWSGALGLVLFYLAGGNSGLTFDGFLGEVADQVPAVLAAVRLPTAFLAAICVVATYLLLKRLFGQQVAILSAVLLAFDPFYLAHSRVIHHDALSASFLWLSFLLFLLHLRQGGFLYPAASGLMAGLAILSKSPSLFLLPFFALASLADWWLKGKRKEEIRRLGRGWLLCAGFSLLTFFLLWPAMWVAPVETAWGVIEKALGYAGAPHERYNFFLGKFCLDPGPLFYPTAILFRLTPLTLSGFLLALPGLAGGLSPRRRQESWLALAFIALYMAFMTTGAKKFDRYMLPVFPFMDFLAAVGLVGFWERWAGLRGKLWPALGLALFAFFQAGFSLPNHPYYLTFYNPLFGGNTLAPKVLLVGWGEGVEQAARYLNGKPGAEGLSVAAWYSNTILGPLFKGRTYKLPVDSQEAIGVVPWYDTDYVVFYLNQVQRGIPSSGTVRFFQTKEPEYTARIKGLDYAWVYKVPPEVPYEAYPYQRTVMLDFGGKILLLGYDVERGPFHWAGKDYLDITFYWQALRPMSKDYRVHLQLIDSESHILSESDALPVFNGFRTSAWEPGTILRDRHGLELAPDLPPGRYKVSVRLYDPQNGEGLKVAGQEWFTFAVMIAGRGDIRPGS